MQSIIKESIAKSISYEDYKILINNLLQEKKSTGHTQNESLTHYSELNQTRMRRLDKTLNIDETVLNSLKSITKEYVWLTISEGWCGDAAQILPVLHKMATYTTKIDFRIILRDENPELMNLYLTNGSQSIPIVIIVEKDSFTPISHWGPRPKPAAMLVKEYKEKYGFIDETLKTNLQKWYFDDKGISIQREILSLLQ